MTTNFTPQIKWLPHVLESSTGQLRVPAHYGRLLVPERRGVADSPSIELAVIRIPANTSRPAAPIVLLAGGPGNSGFYLLRSILPVIDNFRRTSDIIAFDQRGTGLTLPRLTSPFRLNLPLAEPINRSVFLEHFRQRSRAAAAFWADQGVDLNGYTTVDSADDVDALRQALNVPRINLFGASYGSHLGLATIRRYGDHINRAVLGLVEGPDHTIKLPNQVQQHLYDLDQQLRQDPIWRARLSSLTEPLAEIIAQLDQHPVRGNTIAPGQDEEVQVTANGFDVQLRFAQVMGRVGVIQQLPTLIHDLLLGRYEWLFQQCVRYRTSWLSSAMTYVMDSASGLSVPRQELIAQQAPNTVLGDLTDFPFPHVAEAWGAPDLGADFRSPISAAVPTLFVSGSRDPRTPPANAEEIRQGFPNSSHLVVNGMTHDDAFLSLPDVAHWSRSFMPPAISQLLSCVCHFPSSNLPDCHH